MKESVTVLLLLRRVDCNDGVASYCETLIKGLNAIGDRVVIVSGPVTQLYGSAARHEAISEAVLDWIRLPDIRSKIPNPAIVKTILSVIRARSVDVISPQGLSLLPLAFLISKLARRPVAGNYHPSMGGRVAGEVATGHSATGKMGYAMLLTLFGPDRLIAISSQAAEFFRKDCGFREDRITIINNGIDTATYRPPTADERRRAREKFLIGENALVCALAGRLNFNKGHDIVIDAIRILRAANPALKIICLFSGDGDQADEIKAHAFKSEADADSFRFLGFTDNATLREAYWASDIGLLPSRFEGFGISMVEAMACGCVPIRTPGGGWQEQIIDGVNGFLIPFNDPPALADRILALSNPERRALMREQAIQHAAAHFNQKDMISKTSGLYRMMAK